MNTITKTIAGIFGMMMLLTVQNVNAQTYYGYVSAKEKSENVASDKVNRLIVSNVFEVKFCRSSQVSFYSIDTGGGTTSAIQNAFKAEYDYGYKLRGYYINQHYADVQFFKTYDEAERSRKSVIAKYKNDAYNPVYHQIVAISLECFK